MSLDSYAGGMYHNYYLYEEDGKFTFIPWDFNFSFGSYCPVSLADSDLVNLSIDNFVNQDSAVLLKELFNNEEYREIYHDYLSKLIEGPMSEDVFTERVDELRNLIDDSVKNDPTAFFTYEQYDNAFYDNSDDHSDTGGINGRDQGVGTSNAPKLITFALRRAENIALQLAGELPQDEILVPGNQDNSRKNRLIENEIENGRDGFVKKARPDNQNRDVLPDDDNERIRNEDALASDDLSLPRKHNQELKENDIKLILVSVLIFIILSLVLYLYPRVRK